TYTGGLWPATIGVRGSGNAAIPRGALRSCAAPRGALRYRIAALRARSFLPLGRHRVDFAANYSRDARWILRSCFLARGVRLRGGCDAGLRARPAALLRLRRAVRCPRATPLRLRRAVRCPRATPLQSPCGARCQHVTPLRLRRAVRSRLAALLLS